MATIDATAPPVGPDVDALFEHYRTMFLIRRFEEAAERQYKAARIGGYCHLSSGQEATTVGTVAAMQPDDLLVTGYRCHGFALARGVPPEAVMAELFGRAHGCAHGRGGSMHLLDVSRGYYGGWGIVGGQMPIATGMALSLVRRGAEQAVLCELGDGAVNMGAWHESLNLASVWRLPVVFLVINNLYGMGTSVDRASAETDLFKRAGSYRMDGERVDGDDLEEVEAATSRLLRRAREERRPAVLEAVTYRYRGHSVADAGLAYRSREEIEAHRREDPLVSTRQLLEGRGVLGVALDALEHDAEDAVERSVAYAEADAAPAVDRLAAGVYADGSEEQFERMRLGAPFGEAELVFAGGLGE
jgi:pyruvate dehydrogenase E1 component alpha subunit